MNVEQRGAGRPILFVHGWRLDAAVEAADIEPIFEHLTGWSRLYPDLPGMGESVPDPSIEDMNGYLNALIDLVDDTFGTEPFAIAGTSAGAALARAIAHERADRVRGLMLRVPMLDFLRREPVADDDERDATLDTEPSDAWVPETFRNEAAAKRATLWEPARARAAAMGFVQPIRNDPQRYVLNGDFGSVLTAPTLIVAGRQDTRVGFEDALIAMHQYPRATVAVLDRARHVLPTGDVRLFRSLVTDWLSRMD